MFNKNESHNRYSEEPQITSKTLSKYLIMIQRIDGTGTEIIPTDNITTAIEIAKRSKRLCSIFERRGSMGKNWQYLIDMGETI